MQRRSNDQPGKVEPCDICGAVGFAELCVTCTKCNVFREHIYCMRKNLTEIPDYWFCETCQSKNGTTSPCEVKQDVGLQGTTSPCEVKQDTGLQVSTRKKSFRTAPTGKVKYLHEDEVIKLSSCNISMKATPSSTSPMTMTKKASSTLPITKRAHVASKSVIPKIPSPALKPNPSLAPMAHGKFPRNGVQKNPMNDQHASSSKGPTKENQFVSERRLSIPIPDRKVQPLKVHTRDPQIEKSTKREPCKDFSATKSLPVAVSDAATECNGFNREENKIQSIPENFNRDRKYFPSSIRAWSGRFQILQAAASVEFYDGFEAKPPCVVNRKAYNLSSKIPQVLQVESLSALNVLTDVFQNYSPTLQDIALYFFPSDSQERSRKSLNSLLKFMNDENSMLRSLIDGVELLVFTSHQLNEHSRGTIAAVHEGYFLWGVFRSKKSNTSNDRSPAMDPVDMDIDMIGGNDIAGRVDNVLNSSLRSPSQVSLQGIPLLSPTSIKVEEKTLTPRSNLNLNGGDRTISSENLRKNIKSEHSWEPSSWSPVRKYRKMHDILESVPPGFEGHGAAKPSNIKRRYLY
ncbi:uncharacterized protein LOC131624402 isoform X2 [Vicia villosa]|uniref:uncharacterized protein LOC131624402 isoform X2 n=1 Tax=Vicia villosa TaxID=3911 RepID=UPI00273A9298|nr:uncharacterized protein LOC131624402 isoform X2 [Vicia villosa]